MGYTLDIATGHALDWLRNGRAKDRPFLLMLTFNAPHRWWDPGPNQLALYRDTLFAEPPTFWDSAGGRASPAKDPEMKIGLDLVPRDLKLADPTNLTHDQLTIYKEAYAKENAALQTANLTGEFDSLFSGQFINWEGARCHKSKLMYGFLRPTADVVLCQSRQ
ncbi:MAG TPA: hypothetical protein VES88_14990 [Gemmatimonadaceae bacterium]|nr:hypothetical protein [Gemmatimonadaceae bacterium]